MRYPDAVLMVARNGVRPRRLRGVTLVEILVSILILSIGVIGLSQLYVAGTLTYKKAHATSLARQRAQLELEKVQNLKYTSITTSLEHGTLVPDYYNPSVYRLRTQGDGIEFDMNTLLDGHGTITFSHFSDGTSTYENLLRVQIDITWGGPPNTQSLVSVVTLMTNK